MSTDSTMLDPSKYDEIDRKILYILKENGRATNQDIARELKIAAATVSARIRRMEDANAMRVVAAVDFSAYGYDIMLAIGVEVQNRSAEAVAGELAALSQVFAAHLVTGAKDIELLVVLEDLSELPEFLMSDVAKIKGIRSLSPAIAVEVAKYDFDVSVLK
jgi:Lrp/AsnC family transcriptional regulator, leucine-responsive regulatory protein